MLFFYLSKLTLYVEILTLEKSTHCPRVKQFVLMSNSACFKDFTWDLLTMKYDRLLRNTNWLKIEII